MSTGTLIFHIIIGIIILGAIIIPILLDNSEKKLDKSFDKVMKSLDELKQSIKIGNRKEKIKNLYK